VFASANAGADGGEADGVAGGYRPRRGIESARLQNGLGDSGGYESSGTDLHELAAGHWILGHYFFALTIAEVIFRTDLHTIAEVSYGQELLHRRELFSESIL
jgi:hypothetical protein